MTFFDVLVGMICRSFAGLWTDAETSIGEAAIAASRLGGAEGRFLTRLAGSACQAAHETIPMGAGVAIPVLPVALFAILRGRAVRPEPHV